MQKFTRPITREIEVAGERLALTLDAEGVTLRLVGSRRPPHQVPWPEVVWHLTRGGVIPTPEEVKAALEKIRKGASPPPASPGPAPATAPAPAEPAAGPGIGPVLARLEKWLAGHRRAYLEGLLPGAAPAALDDLQARLGIPLPASLRALLAWHNGQSPDNMGRFEASWYLMGTEDIVNAKQELDAEAAETGWQKPWIPFLDNDDGDYICLDASQPRAPVREFWQDHKAHPIVSPSLEAWLADKVQAMEQGDYEEDPERGFLLRVRPRPSAAGERTPPL